MRLMASLLVLLHAAPAVADDRAFRLVMTACTTLIGHLADPGKGLEIRPAEPSTFDCTVNDGRAVCSIEGDQAEEGEGKARKIRLVVMQDSERRLSLLQENQADYVSIRPDLGSVSMTSRIVNARFAGSTVCVGSYQLR